MIDLKIDEKQRKRKMSSAARRRASSCLLTPRCAIRPRFPTGNKERALGHRPLGRAQPQPLSRDLAQRAQGQGRGPFGGVNFIELPSSITGTKARIVGLAGKWFPTGAHKVGAALSCLPPELVTGRFDPTTKKAVWPSTGNYCRGGGYLASLLSCPSIAILPAGMSKERFEWLRTMAEEVIATPGSGRTSRRSSTSASSSRRPVPRPSSSTSSTRCPTTSGITQSRARRWRQSFAGLPEPATRSPVWFSFPAWLVPSARGLSPRKLPRGQGRGGRGPAVPDHPRERLRRATASKASARRHVPGPQPPRDLRRHRRGRRAPMRLIRLFNELPAGNRPRRSRRRRGYRRQAGLARHLGVGNLIGAIKFAKHFELGEHDVVFTMFTDSMAMYHEARGAHRRARRVRPAPGRPRPRAPAGHRRGSPPGAHSGGQEADRQPQILHRHRAARKELSELRAQWDDYRGYWGGLRAQLGELDAMIDDFNAEVRR